MYGEQQGSAKGYNRHRPGRKSHHPIMAFVSETEMIANFWLRPGDAHTANNFKAFLEETLLFLSGNVRNRFKTLRHKMPAIPSIIESSGDRIAVKMALHMNRRNRIAKLCGRIRLQFLQSGYWTFWDYYLLKIRTN